MRTLLLPLVCGAFLLVESGCGQGPQPVATLPVATPVPNPPAVPDKSLWAGKTLDTAVIDYLSAASIFTSTLKEIQGASSVTPNRTAVIQAAEKLRIARFALADLSKGQTLDVDTSKKVNDAGAAVSQEVARLLTIPEAKQALHEAFLLVRTAPGLKF